VIDAGDTATVTLGGGSATVSDAVEIELRPFAVQVRL